MARLKFAILPVTCYNIDLGDALHRQELLFKNCKPTKKSMSKNRFQKQMLRIFLAAEVLHTHNLRTLTTKTCSYRSFLKRGEYGHKHSLR